MDDKQERFIMASGLKLQHFQRLVGRSGMQMPAHISAPLQSTNHGLTPDFSQRYWPSLSAEQDHLQDAASGRKAAGAAHLQQVRQE